MLKEKQYIFIAQSLLHTSECKIDIANDLDGRLKGLNNTEGKSPKDTYRYIFICEVQDMIAMINDLIEDFFIYRMQKKEELYLLNEDLFKIYIEEINSHPLFEEAIFIKKKIF